MPYIPRTFDKKTSLVFLAFILIIVNYIEWLIGGFDACHVLLRLQRAR